MKKRKNKTADINNGITITDSISLTINNSSVIKPALLLIITAAAGVFGFVFSFLTLFNFEYYGKPIFLSVSIMFIVCSLIFMFPARAKLMLIPVYAVIGYGVYKFRNEIVYGYASLINTIASDIQITSSNRSYYSLGDDVDAAQCLTVFFIFLFVIITSIVCYNTIIKPRFIFAFLSTFPFIETGLYFGLAPSHLAFYILIAYWISVFAMRIAGNQFHSTSGQPVFVRKKNIFVSSGNLKNNVIETIGIITLVFVLIIFGISSAALKAASYQRSNKVNDVRNNIKTTISDFSIESFINAFNEKSGSIPIGKQSHLGSINSVSFDNQTDIALSINQKLESNLYLRGFVGTQYKNNTWYAIDQKTLDANKPLFESFRQSDIWPQQFNFINNKIMYDYQLSPVQACRVSIKTKFQNSGYMFVPYGANTNGFEQTDDAFVKNNILNAYSYSVYTTPVIKNDISALTDSVSIFKNDNTFSTLESDYSSFVRKNYLSLPENEQMDRLRSEFSYIPAYNGSNMQEIISAITETLHKNAHYSLNPGTTPAGTDLAYYLLMENHKGYCSHFATAGVVLARMAGIPARYSEGYVVIPDDCSDKSYSDDSCSYEINIPDSRAHAWAEFYIDGYGWVPVEFTPGYSEGIVSAEKDSPPATTAQTKAPAQHSTTAAVTTTAEQSQTSQASTHSSASKDHTASASSVETTAPVQKQTEKNNTFLSVILVTAKITLLILTTAAAVLTIIFIRHIVCMRKILLAMRTKSNTQNVLGAFDYIRKLLLYKGISQGNMLPLDFAAYIQENAKGISNTDDIRKTIETALKAGFSNEEIPADECRHAVSTAFRLASEIYTSLSALEKFKFRYFYNLKR